MRAGSLGEVKRAGGAFTAEVRGLAHYLQQPKGRLFQYACDADLGDARCGDRSRRRRLIAGTGAVLDSRERAPVHGERARAICHGLVHARAADVHVGRGVGPGDRGEAAYQVRATWSRSSCGGRRGCRSPRSRRSRSPPAATSNSGPAGRSSPMRSTSAASRTCPATTS